MFINWSSIKRTSYPKKNLEIKIQYCCYIVIDYMPVAGSLIIQKSKMKQNQFAVLLVAALMFSASAFAQTKVKVKTKSMHEKTVMVGGAEMYPSKNIVQNAMNSADHTTLVAAVKAAGLVETLASAGPFTVFAPTNAAFEKLPAGTVEMLLKPENKQALTNVLTYHVVAGKLDSKLLMQWAKKHGGSYELKTVQGGKLWIISRGGKLWLKDEKGGMAAITISDVYQSNGVIHVVDTVLMPG
jgi:uncharacterized surface protein with fasciclin (FAS1) repeats